MNTQTLDYDQDADRESAAALGAVFAQARIEQGLDRREAAGQANLSTELVRSLEEGELFEREAPIFVRGYLTRYARILDLPEQDLLKRYKQLGVQEQRPLQVTPAAKAPTRLFRWLAYLFLLAFIGLSVWGGYRWAATNLSGHEPVTASKPETTPGTTVVVKPVPTPPPAGDSARSSAPLPPPAPAPTAMSAPVVTAAPPATPPAASSAPAVSTPAPAAVATAGPAEPTPALPAPTAAEPAASARPPDQAELALEFTGDCWVEIKDADGNTLAYGVMKAKTARTLSGRTPFAVKLGNSGAVNLRLNGQTVDPATYVRRGGKSRFSLPLAP